MVLDKENKEENNSNSNNVSFSAAEINIVVHATENENKILQSVNDVLSLPINKFSTTSSEGHWGNKILLLTATIGSHEANTLISKIISSLNKFDRDHLSDFFEKYIDEKGNVYIRLDKQRICQGKVSLSESDSIRIRFKPVRRYRPSNTIYNYRGLLSSSE
jgi:RNA binding exosome subunit